MVTQVSRPFQGVLWALAVLMGTAAVARAQEKPVARLFDQVIILKELQPPAPLLEKQRRRLDAGKLDAWLKNYQGRQLMGRVLGALLARYADQRNIQPAPEEIASLRKHLFDPALEQSRKRREKEREAQRRAIESREWTDAQLREMLKALAPGQPPGYQSPSVSAVRENPNLLFEAMDAFLENQNRRMAEEWVRQWKVNAALFQDYGGRVIFQQGGPEPVDAYRRFLEEQEKQGSFQILDAAMVAPFWNYLVNDKMHAFLPEAEGRRAMARPWWEP